MYNSWTLVCVCTCVCLLVHSLLSQNGRMSIFQNAAFFEEGEVSERSSSFMMLFIYWEGCWMKKDPILGQSYCHELSINIMLVLFALMFTRSMQLFLTNQSLTFAGMLLLCISVSKLWEAWHFFFKVFHNAEAFILKCV